MNAYLLAVSSSLLALCACSGGTVAASDVTPHQEPAPPPVDAGAPTGAGTSVFAIRSFDIGDRDATGAQTATAWQSYGFDIDGLATTVTSTDVCQLAQGAARSAQVDGKDGIDNSFGANIVPIILTVLGNDVSTMFNQSLDAGVTPTLIAVDRLGNDTNASPLTARMFVGATTSVAPQWRGSDVFPIDTVSLDANGAPLVAFAQSYVDEGTLVTSPPSGLGALSIGSAGGVSFTLPVTHVQIAMPVAPDATGATSGTLAAILPADAFAAFAVGIAGRLSSSFCSAASLAAITTMIEQASDILVDGTQDPTKPCDGISMGLGFSATRVELGAPTTVPAPPNSCATP